jgi:PIN domain nuclease of toxin-antitoxin system
MGRNEVILLDTHVIIWLTTDSSSVGRQGRAAYENARASGDVAVSAISFWEMAMLTAKGRLDIVAAPAHHRAAILGTGVLELPVTGDIGILAAGLNTLHGDPADRLIVATAMAYNATLMTADRALLRWRNGLPRQDASK